jgi:ATP-dependent RNA helicase RhlE
LSNFDSLGLRPALLRAVRDLGFTEPTPVQAAAIPPALAGRDIIASAATGSGKSAAFGLPLLQALADLPRGTTRALILAPTRELAVQITAHLSALGAHSGVRVAAVYGGVGFGQQAAAFKRGTDIIVATPGRLLDHLSQRTASLAGISFLVIDEADRMLDMGFLPVVRRIMKQLTGERQTMLFSATISGEIAKLAGQFMHDPVRIDLAPAKGPAVGVTQTIYAIDQSRKSDLLVELLKDNTIFSAIAFTRTKARADRLFAHLQKHSVTVERIHSNRSQAQRGRAIEEFKRGKFRVLVATDIASRGIDIVELGHVVNYDVPMVPEDYVHRVGRTARANSTGNAITFVASDEEKYFAQIERSLGKRLDRSKLPELPAVIAAQPQRAAEPARSNRSHDAKPTHAKPAYDARPAHDAKPAGGAFSAVDRRPSGPPSRHGGAPFQKPAGYRHGADSTASFAPAGGRRRRKAQ